MYKIEKRVSHHEWDEVVWTAEQWKDFMQYKKDANCLDFPPSIEFIFEDGYIFSDEIWRWNGKHIYVSSYCGGIVEWDEELQSYVKYYKYSSKLLGKLVCVKCILNSELKAMLEEYENSK